MRSLRKPIAAITVGVTVAVVALLGVVGSASAHPRQLTEVKRSLDDFHSVNLAQRHDFSLVTDINGVSCIDGPLARGTWATTTPTALC